jgi:hypothetical protein
MMIIMIIIIIITIIREIMYPVVSKSINICIQC